MTFHLLPACIAPGDISIECSGTVRVTDKGCEVLNEVPLEVFVIE
jgi:Xaa-Pro aminopeptidase